MITQRQAKRDSYQPILVGPLFEAALDDVLRTATLRCPPRLRQAIRYTVFPGGGRLRPSLCLAVAAAEGAPPSGATATAAAAIELIHCGSLAHDDLPCFDDADLRRGRPTVHRAFSEALAVLAGDALIVLAFEAINRTDAAPPFKAEMYAALARASGPGQGIIGGQGWESESDVDLNTYHAAKTGALFEAAAALGALAAEADPEPWLPLGRLVGRAYQLADDLADARLHSSATGKTSGKDSALGRPNAVDRYEAAELEDLLRKTLREAWKAVPPCARPEPVRDWLEALAQRLIRLGLLPAGWRRRRASSRNGAPCRQGLGVPA